MSPASRRSRRAASIVVVPATQNASSGRIAVNSATPLPRAVASVKTRLETVASMAFLAQTVQPEVYDRKL